MALDERTGRWRVAFGPDPDDARMFRPENLEPTEVHKKLRRKPPSEVRITVVISRVLDMTTEVCVKAGSTMLEVRQVLANLQGALEPGAVKAEDFRLSLPASDFSKLV